MSEALDILSEVFSHYIVALDDGDDVATLCMETSNLGNALVALNLSELELDISKLDPRSTGLVDFETFVEVLSPFVEHRLNGVGKETDDSDLVRLFRLFKNGQSGAITVKDLQRISSAVKDRATEKELADMVYIAGEKAVSFEQFSKIMREVGIQ